MRDRVIPAMYLLALVLFVALAVAVVYQLESLGQATRWVHHTQEVLTELNGTLGELRDIETGQRGYLIAGDERFLEPYERGAATVRARYEGLVELTADNPVQQRQLARLRPLLEQKLAFTERTVALVRAGERARALELVAEGRGRELMDDIREIAGDIEREERELLAERSGRSDRAAWRTTTLTVVANAFAFTFLAGGTFLMMRELHRRRALEAELTLQRERAELTANAELADARVRAMIEEMPVAIALLDVEHGRRTADNTRFRALAGEGDALALVRGDGSPYPEGTDPITRARRDGARRSDELLQVVRDDGARVDAVATSAPLRARDGRVVSALVVLEPLDERRQSEEERLWFERFRAVFSSALGHDLRNPLSVVSAGTGALARRVEPGPESKLVERMRASAERMTRMIDQLLEMTQARLGGELVIERARVDLGALAREVVERIEVAWPEREIVLETAGELRGQWDGRRLARAIEDLVRNALEHGRADAPVRVRVRGEKEQVQVEVHNEGNPIDEAERALVFDPFRRAAERRRTKSVGLGLGLYLAREAVLAHGGLVELDSSAARGTVFRITVPRA